MRPARRGPAVRLADFGSFAAAARRTRALRVGLALGLVAAAAGLVVAARPGVPGAAARERGPSTVVAVDLSLSIPPAANERMRRLLGALAEGDRRVGLVIFSDTAYELFPPGTPARELRPLLRFLTPITPPGGERAEGFRRPPSYVDDPWTGTFRGGTRISRGLELARRMLERDGIHDDEIVLVSDLRTDETDVSPLQEELSRIHRGGIRLRVAALFALPEDSAFVERFTQPQSEVDIAALAGPRRERGDGASEAPIRGLLAAAAALLLVLAANEAACMRLELPRPGRTA